MEEKKQREKKWNPRDTSITTTPKCLKGGSQTIRVPAGVAPALVHCNQPSGSLAPDIARKAQWAGSCRRYPLGRPGLCSSAAAPQRNTCKAPAVNCNRTYNLTAVDSEESPLTHLFAPAQEHQELDSPVREFPAAEI
jgi:hypothetical protein